jgi:hypothetical protein
MRFTRFVESVGFLGLTRETQETDKILAFVMRIALCEIILNP